MKESWEALQGAAAPYAAYLLIAVIVLVILIIYMSMMSPKEGITAGGDQQLEQGYFAGGRTEAFGSRSALDNIAEALDQPPKQPMSIDVAKMLQAQSLKKLANELKCSGGYQSVAPNQPYGWLRAASTNENADVGDLFKMAGREMFAGKREGLDDASLSATMAGL